MSSKQVMVVGAGPSGLLLALLLALKGVEVVVLEAAKELSTQPRATHYLPPAVYELRRAGIIKDMYAAGGFVPKGVCWRKADTTILADLPMLPGPPDHPDEMICLPLDKVSQILAKHLALQPTAEIRYGHQLVDFEERGEKVIAKFEVEGRESTISADFIVGCDGANSKVRRVLFGDSFPGTTWDKQIVATNVYYDFDKFGWQDSNFIIHPENYFMAARISKDGLWRVTYGEVGGLTGEEYVARQPEKFRTLLPGHPEPSEYRLVSMSPYKVHQRCAAKFRVGRVLLAADAAHLCNPFGGLGLVGGIIDVGGLSDCLNGIFQGKANLSILDRYDTVRREKYDTIVNPISSENFRRLWDQDPEIAAEKDPFLQLLQQVAGDPEKILEFQMGMYGLQHDFTQYYTTSPRATL